eukprot:8051386-Pyramimonas_sp.AAC.1
MADVGPFTGGLSMSTSPIAQQVKPTQEFSKILSSPPAPTRLPVLKLSKNRTFYVPRVHSIPRRQYPSRRNTADDRYNFHGEAIGRLRRLALKKITLRYKGQSNALKEEITF